MSSLGNSNDGRVPKFFFISPRAGGRTLYVEVGGRGRGMWGGGVVTCVSRRNCSRLMTRLEELRDIRQPRVSHRVTRTHSGKSLSRGTRCSTTGRTRNVLRVGVGRLGLAVDRTHVVSADGLGASAMRILAGIRLGGAGANVGVYCTVIPRDRTGLGTKGVSIGAPVTRKLLNGGPNSITSVGAPNNVVDLRMLDVDVTWNCNGCVRRGDD